MSHFAEVDENNVVTRVLVGDNDMPNEGYDWLIDNLGGTWVKTSDNNNIRGTYAGIGYEYNLAEDIFITPQPYPSWTRSGSFWNAPIPYPNVNPDDETRYSWDEEAGNWIEIQSEIA